MATLTQSPAALQQPDPQAALSFSQLFRVVPPVVRGYVLSPAASRALDGAYAAAGLTPTERTEVGEQVLDVFLGVRPVMEFADALWSALPWDAKEETRARQLALNILGYVFLPARRYLGDVEAFIRELGGEPSAYPQQEMAPRNVAYEDAVTDAVFVIDPDRQMDLERRDRLAALVEAQLRGQRAPQETVERLLRTTKTGGLELDEQQASAVAALIEAQKLLTTFRENPVNEGEEEEEGEENEAEGEAVRDYTPEEIRAIYAGSPEEQAHIRAAVSAYGNDGTAAAAAFAPSAPGQDPWSRLGALLALAQSGKLLAAAKASPAYADAVRRYLAAQRRDVDPASFMADPTAPKFFNVYLQLTLKRYAGFADNASARYAVRIANLLKKAGVPMPTLAAFDPSLGDFRWVEPML